MTPSTPNERLNFVLDQIKHERSYNDLYREIESHANMKGQFSNGEIDLIMDKLRTDGYIDYIAGQKINKDMRASDGLSMRRTFNGNVFFEAGGYVQEDKDNRTELTNKRLINFSLIFGGVAAGVYYIVQLFEMGVKAFYS